jgi:hypothetical protein
VSIIHDAKAIVKSDSARIWKADDGLLRFIALRTSEKQIRILAFSVRIHGSRYEVLDVKCRTAIVPLLTMKAIYAPEDELIA